MGFFQNSVLNKHLKTQDSEAVKAAYQKFTDYFHDPVIQQNIRAAKEEQFQEGFLRELFVNIFGYVLNPHQNFNLTSELKNEKGAKKADGAILQNGKALGVIELKGTDTKDLDKINIQAFNYKNNQSGCIYVITSNFEKLRFFIHNSVEHLEFNLFTLTKNDFQLLWLCLSAENLLKGIPLKIKEESLLEEVNITKQLYKDYATFRTDIWQNMVKNNPEVDKLLLFKKTQKLLDRFLFIFFAEDSGLLPPNSISRIVNRWIVLKNEDAYKPLYEIFRQYFGYIDKGRKGQKEIDDIFAYNGGLFQPDELLDTILIDDVALHQNVMKLTAYDFQSDVDVNILGHIFENSLNEIENITAEIVGQAVDKSKTKRKKDGVFYTPKYITKYIVENTIGKLCEEKKSELGIIDEDYGKGRTNRKKEIVKKLDENLHVYRDWLRGITICDPACGSGAFLNQALEFLLEEHAYIDELFAQLFGASIVFQDESNHILEKNIYGVDINEESVDIAKLSLWLRTAQRGRKLTTLNNNIKCGNSLIDDPDVAGDKAFDWHKEFPAVFHKKNKVGWHITCATHNSRYSQRMFDNHVKLGEAVWLSDKEEEIVSQTIAGIVEKDKLNIPAYNICGDHMHILLVCEEDELPAIVQKIKSMSARACNIAMGRTIPGTRETWEHAPMSAAAPVSTAVAGRGEAQAHLWTQKFGSKEITSEEQLQYTLAYIRNNRVKHMLREISQVHADSVTKIICSTEYAFRTEYKGGFDVVIGNPPYVRAELITQFAEYFQNTYKTFQPAADLFTYFYEKGFSILKYNGLFAFISNTFDKTKAAISLRDWLKNNATLLKYVDFTDVQIFEGATTYPIILIAKNQNQVNNQFQYIKITKGNEDGIDFYVPSNLEQVNLENDNWAFGNNQSSEIIRKLQLHPYIKEKYGKCYYGVKTALNEAFLIPIRFFNNKEIIKPIFEGKELSKWTNNEQVQSLILFKSKWTKAHFGNLSEIDALGKIKDLFPDIFNHLLPFEQKAKARYDKGEYWWELRNCAYYHLFEQPKIIFPNLQNSNKFSLDESGVYINAPAVMLSLSHLQNPVQEGKFVLGILNSKLIWYFLKTICVVRSGGYIEVKPQYFEQIPIPAIPDDAQNTISEKTDQLLILNKELQECSRKFKGNLKRKFIFKDLPRKLNDWYLLSYGQFIMELGKKKIKLSLKDEAEWEEYFLLESQKALELKSQIEATDKEIDQMVYKLYDLTDEEIKIVENA